MAKLYLKGALVVALMLLVAPLQADKVDYTQLKPKDFAGKEDRSEFYDTDTQETYRITNTDYARGISIQVEENGRKRWKKHGVFYSMRSNGTVSAKDIYYYGRRHGICETYNSKGKVQFRKPYVNGLLEGTWEQYNDRGQLVVEGPYENNMKNGVFKEYYGEKLNFLKHYKDNRLDGEHLQYNTRTGKVVARKIYKDGKQIGKTEWFD